MMPEWLTLEATIAYALQFAVIALVGLLLPLMFRLRDPQALEPVWHWALGIALLAPLGPFFPPYEWANPAAVSFSVDAATAAAPAAARVTLLQLLAAGAALMLLWRTLGLIRLWLLRRSSAPLELTDVLGRETLALHRRFFRIGLTVEPRYFRCDRIASPLVYGVIRPAVLLPESFFEAPTEQRRAVLVHELIHVQRNDWLGLLWLEIWRSLLWFHPVIHLMLHRLANVREQLVDRKAIEVTADRRSYLEALVSIARAPAPDDRLLAPLFLEKNRLKQRVQVILEEKPMPAIKRYAWLALITAALFFVANWARDSFPVYAQSDAPEIHKVGDDGVSAPRLLSKVEPEYTEEARERKINGTVTLSCEVHADGRAHNIKILEGLEGGLNDKAIEAVEAWKFQPGLKDGKPVAVSATVEINFRLLDKAPQPE